MKKIRLICDSSCDLTEKELQKFGIETVQFMITIDNGESYIQDKIGITNDEFYKLLIEDDGLFPKTSCPPTNDYYNIFKKYIDDEIICLTLTQKFSGSYSSAMAALDMIKEEFPESNIHIIDSTLNTVSFGLLAKNVAKMISNDMEIANILEEIETVKITGRIFFTTTTLKYLEKGGRIGKFAVSVASKVQLMPLVYMKDGDASVRGVVLGRKRSIKKVLSKVASFFKRHPEEKVQEYDFCIGYGSDKEEADKFLIMVQDYVNTFTDRVKVSISQIGSTIGSHVGPYSLGIGFVKKPTLA